MAQIRCVNPTCGSYRVYDHIVRRLKPKDGEPYSQHPILVGIGFAIICVLVLVGLNFIRSSGLFYSRGLLLLALDLVVLMTGIVFIIRGIVIAIRKVAVGIPVYSYECSTCGYKWSWTAGTPQPTVAQYTPNQLLFDEQKKRDADAAAWAYEMQRRQREDSH
ncbi:MAG TPA: hypothetical protein VFS83_04855 [Ktedonobacterales bacterium]|nr:hypothetical protein [Ktedonobacterales bacterium]